MRVLTAVVLVGLSLTASGSDMPRPAPIPRPQPEPVGPDWVPCDFCGRVVGITEKGQTIKPERGLKIFIIKPLPDGTTREWVYVQDNTQPPREFVFNDCLFFDRPGPKTPSVRRAPGGRPAGGGFRLDQLPPLPGLGLLYPTRDPAPTGR